MIKINELITHLNVRDNEFAEIYLELKGSKKLFIISLQIKPNVILSNIIMTTLKRFIKLVCIKKSKK
jgi:hypothetical protein